MSALFRQLVLAGASHSAAVAIVKNSSIFEPLVKRFVAGDSLADALSVTAELNSRGIAAALDFLGENTTSAEGAESATREALAALDGIHQRKLAAYLSVKLTQLGMDLGEHLTLDNARLLLDSACAGGHFVRIDMEGSSYTARTIELFTALRARYPCVGIVIQSCLYRSESDVRRLVALGASIRLVKGAYAEPPHIAFRRKRDTDRNYMRLTEYLLHYGMAPAIATHDERIIEASKAAAKRLGVSNADFEFQMLYGVRRDLQERLAADGYRVRVYLPFGSQWYPYLMRRLAERPANLAFIASSLMRERQMSAGRNR